MASTAPRLTVSFTCDSINCDSIDLNKTRLFSDI
jgi:hypothetical protein